MQHICYRFALTDSGASVDFSVLNSVLSLFFLSHTLSLSHSPSLSLSSLYSNLNDFSLFFLIVTCYLSVKVMPSLFSLSLLLPPPPPRCITLSPFSLYCVRYKYMYGHHMYGIMLSHNSELKPTQNRNGLGGACPYMCSTPATYVPTLSIPSPPALTRLQRRMAFPQSM